MFYMFKFGIFLLGIVVVFGASWWFEQTTLEGECPRCNTFQRGPKNEPFQCLACGEDLESKGDSFIKYVKSGKVQGGAWDTLQDTIKEARGNATVPMDAPPSSSSGSSRPPPKKDVQVVDVEVV